MIKEQAKLHLKLLDDKQIKTITQPQVFLSYAWEADPLKNEAFSENSISTGGMSLNQD